jgi:ubiquitin carboxyl-terminal hydrolase 36/42
MNSVLQCLLHTPPLAELLLSNRRLTASSASNGFDPIGMTRQLLEESLGRREYVSPQTHAKTLKRVGRR